METSIEYRKKTGWLNFLQHDPFTILRIIRERNKENRLKRVNQEIKESFQVKEFGGRLWITHDGVAVKELDRNMKTDAILQTLQEIRKCAVEHCEIAYPYMRYR